ncbi:MAG: cytochrome C oxidase subunit I [Candidatus Rokubacteria bacterium RIFCSPLOWO2_12_FULL_71_22]|nr:MAG: cytochrome C oxidase subunit I [Candidatus Rokubacteria bacterium RIFCSPLOWO2_02_FULL_72_37]OGL18139.1 MAG: cytochrome C oxidase subunit I [Candidatus Rokubacteria bacterium RIFCSPLOWO2_12_FULL_71_22]
MTRSEDRLTAAFVAVALVALFGGVLTGFFQALEHAGMDVYPSTPLVKSYYHSLTLHGVLNVLVWTTFFICGFVPFMTTRALGRPLALPGVAWLTFWVMLGGFVLAAIPLLGNAATVMFTFYPPLKAHWAFYVGLTLVVVGTWLVTWNLALTWRAWRREHAGERTPLAAFMGLVTFAMWTIASLGIAAEMLVMLIPWSLGLIGGTDPLLARVLFWFTGHPIVYFWLLPAYMSWYTLAPRQAGGKLFSDPLARTSFILFLVLSTPLGFHHQYTDPGIHVGWKLVHAFLTFAVFFPSLLTFFNVVASLESGARARGGKGWIAWFAKLPWGDPSLAAQVLAMLLFTFGGIGGLINASYNLNLVVHNTAWIVGHLHLTVGTAVTLTFMGICYWLVPYLAGKALWSRRLAQAQVWIWFVGMIIFSNTLHRLGLLGMPRRTMIGAAAYVQPEWKALLPLVGVGASLLFLSSLAFFLNLVLTLVVSRAPAPAPAVPAFTEALSGADHAPAILDRWRPWIALAFVLIAIAYGPTLVRLALTTPFNTPGLRVW